VKYHKWWLPLMLALLLPLQAQAAKKPHPKKPPAAPATAAAVVAAPAPADIADAFHESLRQGKREQALALLAPDATMFETGYVELDRDAYAKGHLSDDADFASVTDYKLIRRSVFQEAQTAWVLTLSSIQGIFGDQHVDLEQTETMLLRQGPAGWQIVHVHWSAHPRVTGDAGPAAESTPAPSTEPPPAPATVPAAPSSTSMVPPVAQPAPGTPAQEKPGAAAAPLLLKPEPEAKSEPKPDDLKTP
jgi:hypothetical protein